jgi:hypothetical protein
MNDDPRAQKVKMRNENMIGYLVYINKWNGQCVVELENKTIEVTNFENLVIIDKKQETDDRNPLG